MAPVRQTAEKKWPLDDVLAFLSLVWEIEHRLQRTSKSMESAIGVTGPQRLVLRLVEQFPDISPGELAHLVQLHPSTLTGVLKRLVDKRLLARQVDPLDARRARLRVCKAAKPMTRQSPGTVEAAVTRVLTDMPPAKIQHAREVLSRFASELRHLHR